MNSRRHIPAILLCCLITSLLTSCEKTFLRIPDTHATTYYQSTDARGWHRSDTLTLNIPPQNPSADSDTPRPYDLSLRLRLIDTYPYRNLQLKFTVQELYPLRRRFTIRRTVDPQGHILHADTTTHIIQRIHTLQTQTIQASIFDTDDRTNGTALPHIQVTVPAGTVSLDPHRAHRILITHVMRLDPLPGITETGILVQPQP